MDPAPSKPDIKYPLRWIFIPFLGISIGFLAIILATSRHAPSDTLPAGPTIRICVFQTGKITFDDQPVSIGEADARLNDLSVKKGVVRYYREAGPPPPQATQILSMITKYQLPITLPDKPASSDSIDGQSHPK